MLERSVKYLTECPKCGSLEVRKLAVPTPEKPEWGYVVTKCARCGRSRSGVQRLMNAPAWPRSKKRTWRRSKYRGAVAHIQRPEGR
jgi:hypothetical protein